MFRLLLLIGASLVTSVLGAQVEHYHTTSATGLEGTDVQVSMMVDTDGPLDGWSYGICYDPTVITLATTELGAAATVVAPAFHALDTTHVGGVTVGSLISFAPPFEQLSPGTDLELLRLTFTLTGAPGAVSPIEPCSTLGSPPVALLLVVDGAETVPTSVGSTVEILTGPMFVRGDANGDGATNIIDAIRLLELIFIGTDPITCVDQVDTNDDEFVNILDAIFLLQVAVAGTSTMPAPSPGCGLDPTETGEFDCAIAPTLCQ